MRPTTEMTMRSMIASRDDALCRKDREIVELRREIDGLKNRLRSMTPIGAEDVLAKKRMADWHCAHEMLRKDQGTPETASVSVMALATIRDRDEQAESLDVATKIIDETLDAAKTLGQLVKLVETLRR